MSTRPLGWPAEVWWSLMGATMFAAGGSPAREPPRDAFLLSSRELSYRGPVWSARADPVGWASLKVGPDEFLHKGADWASIGFCRENTWVMRFPSRSIISHDEWKGRQGMVFDGVFMVRLRPTTRDDEMEWYAGFNDDHPHDLVIWVNDDVWMIRSGDATMHRWRLAIEQLGNSTPTPLRDTIWLVHRSGRSLGIAAPSRAVLLTDPTGVPRQAILIPCRGFTANTIRGFADAEERDDIFLSSIALEVDSRPNRYGATAALPQGVRSAIYEVGDEVEMALHFKWWGPRRFSGIAVLEIRHALGSVETREERPVGVDPVQRGESVPVRVRFAPQFRTPGISDVWCRLLDHNERVLWIEHFRVAYAVEHLLPDAYPPEDLRAFWDQTLAELRSRSLNAAEEPAIADHPLFDIRFVSFDSLAGRRIWAILFIPREGVPPYPAIVTAHPGTRGINVNRRPDGTYGARPPARPGFVTIQPLIRGHRPDDPDTPFNHPWWGDLRDREDYAARHWYAAMVRSVDYLISRPDLVDPKRIVALGGSQGGALAIALSALDPRIAICFADSPSHGRTHDLLEGRYESFGPSPGQIPPDRTLEQTRQLLSYFDPVNLAPWIQCPTYIGLHIGDLTVHAMSGLSIYANLTALRPDQKALYLAAGHYHAAPRSFVESRNRFLNEIANSRNNIHENQPQ